MDTTILTDIRTSSNRLWYEDVISMLKNKALNSLGVSRSIIERMESGDISGVMNMLGNRDEYVIQAIKEYNVLTHSVMKRPNKAKYRTEKLPRNRAEYINEVALFFMFGCPVEWRKTEGSDTAFAAFKQFLSDVHFDANMRRAKRIAGSETESAKLYHIYKDSDGKAAVKCVVLSYSKGYRLRPLFDQYGTLQAFGYTYFINENGKSILHFDLHTPNIIYECSKESIGWKIQSRPNPTGKINVIYYSQKKEWNGVQLRIDREEDRDSRVADTNNYFSDPIAKATADVINKLTDPNKPGKMIQLNGSTSSFEYVNPPTASELSKMEGQNLHDSILYDSFTPDFSFDNMKGIGVISGEAAKRAMALGYLKRDNHAEDYGEMLDRESNLIIAIMSTVTNINMASELSKLKVKWQLSDPFQDSTESKWQAITNAKQNGLLSTETAINMMSIVDNVALELDKIKSEKTDSTQAKKLTSK